MINLQASDECGSTSFLEHQQANTLQLLNPCSARQPSSHEQEVCEADGRDDREDTRERYHPFLRLAVSVYNFNWYILGAR